MLSLTRRNMVFGAAATSLAFGLNGKLEVLASAYAASNLDLHNPNGMKHFRFRLGDIEVIQLFDGEVLVPHNPNFIVNASIDETKAALSAADLPDDAIPLCYTITILKIHDEYIMFDAGNSSSRRPQAGRLTDAMDAVGLKPSDISRVVVTHFHPDHIFGLFGEADAQVYPHAEILVPDTEYMFWTDDAKTVAMPEGRQSLARRVQSTFPTWKNISRYHANTELLAGITSVPTYGHTPGHTSFHVSSGSEQMMILADVSNIQQLFLRNPGWHAAFDLDGAMAEETRRKMFDRCVADDLIVTGYHYGMPGCGRISRDGSGYVFAPLA